MIASLALNMRCRFGIAGLSAKKSSSLSAGVLPSSVSALSPRSATQSGSPTGATVASPSSAPRRMMARKRGSRPSAQRELRQIRPGEQRAGGQQQFAARGCMQTCHGHLRRNSGAMTRSAKAWVRLSARAMVSRVSAEASGPSALSSKAQRIGVGRAAGRRTRWRRRADAARRRSTPLRCRDSRSAPAAATAPRRAWPARP